MLRKSSLPFRYQNKAFLLALGTHCRQLRTKAGLSIDRMVKLGNRLSPGSIQRLEMGQADVQISLLYRYAQVLEIPLHDLLNFPFEPDANENEIIPYDPEGPTPKGGVPFFPIEVAAGAFRNDTFPVEPQGWVIIDQRGPLRDYFVAKITGKSMEPTIRSGTLCLFKKYSGGVRNGQIMLIQARGLTDPESGSAFVIKRYQRITPVAEDEERGAVVIHLLSDNPKFRPIVLRANAESEISTPAIFVKAL